MAEMMELDGSILEGGGQIIRMSVAFSAILGKPIRIRNIRKGRSSPGLKAQHLAGVKLVGEICRADMSGVKLGSLEIGFRPTRTMKKKTSDSGDSVLFEAKIETAGAVTLLCQASLPCLLFLANSQAQEALTQVSGGGTNVGMAPQVEYYNRVFKENLRTFFQGSSAFSLDVQRKGYFPKGGARVRFGVKPSGPFMAIQMVDPGDLRRITIQSSVSGVLPISVAQRMVEGAKKALGLGLGLDLGQDLVQAEVFEENTDRAFGNGSSIVLVAETTTGCFLGSSGLGSPKSDPFAVGEEAGKELADSLTRKVCVDQHCQDQLIIFMALARGVSRVLCGPLTLHTETAIHVAKVMTGAEFNVEGGTEGNCIITCKGIGFEPGL